MAANKSEKMAIAKRRFALWRRGRAHRRAATPEALWKIATDLCEDFPVAVVSRELGINRSKISEKLKPAAVSSKRQSVGGRDELPATGSFVTLSLDQSKSVTSGDLDYEWVRPDGAKLRVRLPSSSVSQIVASFLGHEP